MPSVLLTAHQIHQQPARTSSNVLAGNIKGRVGWDDLPTHLQEVIISKLSLVELARVATTCRVFNATLPRVLAEEQKARCNMAAETFSPECVTSLVALIDGFVKGKAVESYLTATTDWCKCAFFEDGRLHNDWRDAYMNRDVGKPKKPPPVGVTVHRNRNNPALHMVVEVFMVSRRGRSVCMELGRERKAASITVYASDDDDVEGVALVQAMLSAGMFQTFFDAEYSVGLCIHGISHLGPFIDRKYMAEPDVTFAGWKALIAPLLPFGSYCNACRRSGQSSLIPPQCFAPIYGCDEYRTQAMEEHMHLNKRACI
jgi:hypothetical protein